MTAGCGGWTGVRPALAALPVVSGTAGDRPVITIPASDPPDRPRIVELRRGAGRAVRAGEVVVTDLDMKVWRGGRQYLSTWATRQPTTVISDGRHVSPLWQRALTGRRPGARVLLISPAAQAFGPAGMAPVGVSPSDTLVEVFDVLGGYRPYAQVGPGSDGDRPYGQEGHGRGDHPAGRVNRSDVPRVEVRPGAEPVVRAAGSRGPRPGVRVLVRGAGPALRPGRPFVANYVAAQWATGRITDSSYERGGPSGFILAPGAVPPGWATALAGIPAGSRVELVVPRAPGFTMTPGGVGAPPGRAAVYVLDLLDVF
jgi:peptidylprolyl isomerase